MPTIQNNRVDAQPTNVRLFHVVDNVSNAQKQQATALFKNQTRFYKSVVAEAGLPPVDRIEICFAGRSNVGKSSLLNALAGHNKLARVSNTPGRTQSLNYYSVGERLYVVDLPGYGYARAPKHTAQQWQSLTRAYVRGRANLRRVFVLIDARRGVLTSDRALFTELDSCAVGFQVVLTKIDKITNVDWTSMQTNIAAVLQNHPTAHPQFLATSVVNGHGIADLRAVIADMNWVGE